MVTITIDGREVQVPAGELLIAAAEKAGTYIPRFCWHSRMKPVGMCRMCLVEVEGPRGKLLTTSCTMPVNDGMVIHTASDTVKKAQEGVLEFLLINHPLDCPVCDKGGECPLQDQTFSHGPGESRFVEEKRHFPKPIPVNDLVLLDRERCILCARCTRFSEEISGDPLIEFIDRGNHTQVNTFPDEPFSSYFSGNTVQICPVGALTAKPYRFRARPWDLEAVESTCTGCSVGCRVSVQSSQNEILRLLGVDVGPTNQGWLCDKGRFGFEYLKAPGRLATPLVRGDDGELHEATWAEALDRAAEGLRTVIAAHGPDAVAGIGGARGTNEEAYAFGRFLRSVVGTGSVDARVGDALDPALLIGGTGRIDDLERAKTILVWGPDLKEELPVLHLRVRRAATALGATLIVIHPRATGLDPDADHVARYRPGGGFDLLDRIRRGDGDLAPVAKALESGPVVAIVGRTGLTESPDLAAAVVAWAAGLPDASVLPVARRGNLRGALDMGLAPGLLPGRRSATEAAARDALAMAWGSPVPAPGRDADGILAGMADGSIKALLLLGADPAADHPDHRLADAAFAAADRPFLVSFDLFLTDSNRHADVVLPVEGFSEVEGTATNLEGRVQKMNRLVPGPGTSRPAVEALADLAGRMGGSLAGTSELVAKEIAAVVPSHAAITWEALDWGEGRDGIVIDAPAPDPAPPTPTHAPDGLALHLARVLYDAGTMTVAGPAFAPLITAAAIHVAPSDADRLGLVSGSPARVTGDAGSAVVPWVADPSLAERTVYLPFNCGVAVGGGPSVTVEPGGDGS
jgi:NADH-quinone oxidoreductase subunit G